MHRVSNVFLGVTTMNRPRYLDKCLRSIQTHLEGVCSLVAVHDDGSDPRYNAEYRRAFRRIPNALIQVSPKNEGVAKSKNALLRAGLASGADWLFLCEDDILVQSPEAITGYIAACEATGISHLSFSHHGPANLNIPDGDGPVSFFTHSIGAWTCYTRECLEATGLFDEQMINAFEHVHHDMRLIRDGFMPGAAPHQFPDASGSAKWLTEIPGSIENSSIRPRDDWHSNIRRSLERWRDSDAETFEALFGEEMPLHAYAMSILS